MHQNFTFLRSHVVQVEVGLISRLEFRAERSLRRDAGDGGLLGSCCCYGEPCYCGAHGSSLGLPPSAGVWKHQHAPISRFAWAEGIGATIPCHALSLAESPARTITVRFQCRCLGIRLPTLKLCSSAPLLLVKFSPRYRGLCVHAGLCTAQATPLTRSRT